MSAQPSDMDGDLADLINEELLARRTKAMFLKNAGGTLAAIAKECGVSIATVRKDLAIVRRDINNEQPTDVIARHRAVIFDIQRANYPAMMRGDKDAAATILRALDREARLLGLDQPVRVLAGVTKEEFANEAARLIERINALDPATLKELERVRRHDEPSIIDVTPEPADEDAGLPTDPDPAPPGDPVPVAGPWRPGQPILDPSAVADSFWSQPGVPRQAGPAEPADPDDDWSNID
ncbi:RNaseE [Mycobacterium phage Indlovu]|nr:RNaseE [Mycobacterium phage Indlovu]